MTRLHCIMIATLALLTFFAMPASADETFTLGTRECAVHEVDFGVRRVDCAESGIVRQRWVCEYTVGYRCRLEGGAEFRSGGYLPTSKGLCRHLCFPRPAKP